MTFWYQVAIVVVSWFLANAMRPKPATPKPAAFEEFQFPQSAEGTAQIVIFGDVWIDDWMVLGLGNFRSDPIVK